MNIISRPSPNHNERAADVPLRYIAIHYTGMRTAQEALTRLTDPAAQVSAHYVITEDGTIHQLVEDTQRAWHAGKSFWRGITDVNSASIGIELVNPGHEFGYRKFPETQIAALKNLLRALIDKHRLDPHTCLLGHSDVAPTRKEDPGELFPWQELAREGLGLWPEATAADNAPAQEGEAEKLLGQIGYDASDLTATLRAFQRRYRQDNLNGQADAQTLALIRALARSNPA